MFNKKKQSCVQAEVAPGSKKKREQLANHKSKRSLFWKKVFETNEQT